MRWIVLTVVALAVAAGAALPAAAAPPDPPEQCRVNQPPGLWPGDYVDLGNGEWDANLHSGLNSDWTKHVRPIGRVRALMIFVDFEDAQAQNANPNQGGRDWRVPQSYWDFLKQSVEFFNVSSNGRFQLDVDLYDAKWFRMRKPTTQYGMTRSTFSIANQKAYAREAILNADPDVDFSPYQMVYIMPPRNATQIAFSPELNLYTDRVNVDGVVVKNGATYGQDMFSWGPKIINHETGHAISLPESYNGSGVGSDIHNFVGGWDLMGNILGHAPEIMAWNKWKVGWLDDHDFGCVAADGTAEYDLSPIETMPDGGTTKKGVVVRTSPTTALVAELRAPIGNDATETVSPGAHRMCDWGVLVYKIDVLVLNSYGTIRVLDAMPGSTGGGCTRDVDIATLGMGQGDGPPRFADPESGTVFEMVALKDGESARLRVTRAATRITSAKATGSSVEFAGTHYAAPTGATYSWALGDGATATGATPTHAYAAPGRYPVTLTVRDGDTVIGTATQTVSVYAPAAGTVGVTADTGGAIATFTPDAGSSATGQDVTFEVYRRSPASPRPAGITSGVAHLQVAQKVVPLGLGGAAALTHASPVAATDVVVACVNGGQGCLDPASGKTLVLGDDGAPVNLRAGVPAGRAAVEQPARPNAEGWVDLWDGETLAGWSYTGTGALARNFLTSLGGSGGASGNNPGVLWYSAKQFKDFELSVDYRTIATTNNGGVHLRFPAPANVGEIDRGGYQVAILDNGTTTRTGSIIQERTGGSTFVTAAPATVKPTREWNTLRIRAVRSHIQVWVNDTLVSTYDDATRNGRIGHVGLENGANNLMYRHVRVRELAPDTVAPTVTIDSPEDGARIPVGTPVAATFACADESELESCTATLDGAPIASGAALNTADYGPHTLVVTAKDAEGHVTTRTVAYSVVTVADGGVGGTVPATLSLTMGAPATFGAFTPGVAKEYVATTSATVTSTAGDATLSVSDPGHLTNGAFSLPQPLRVELSPAAWAGPVSNGTVAITFRQAIGATDALRTGAYSKTLTFTLSTTNP